MAQVKAVLMDEATVGRTLLRMSHEIVEKNRGTDDLVLVGIHRRGAPLATRLQQNIARIVGVELPCATLAVDGFRDDCPGQSPSRQASLPFSVEDKRVVLVDDVLFTGRTVRAAIEAVFSLGRPRSIQLAILVDRGHRELPLRADYVGKSIPTSLQERVAVRLPDFDGATGVELLGPDE